MLLGALPSPPSPLPNLTFLASSPSNLYLQGSNRSVDYTFLFLRWNCKTKIFVLPSKEKYSKPTWRGKRKKRKKKKQTTHETAILNYEIQRVTEMWFRFRKSKCQMEFILITWVYKLQTAWSERSKFSSKSFNAYFQQPPSVPLPYVWEWTEN